MMKVELRTDNCFVARVEVPRFEKPAEVVLWGSRIFKLTGGTDGIAGLLVYNEVFAVTSLTPSPGLPREDR